MPNSKESNSSTKLKNTLLKQALATYKGTQDDTSSLEKAIETLLTGSNAQCEEIVHAISTDTSLPDDFKHWLSDEVELRCEYLITNEGKNAILFAIPLVVTKNAPFKLTDNDAWSIENLFKTSGIFTDYVKLCKVTPYLFKLDQLDILNYSQVYSLLSSLSDQASTHDTIEPASVYTQYTPNMNTTGPFESRLLVGVIYVSDMGLDDPFSSEYEMDDITQELNRILFKYNAGLSGMATPMGFFEDLRRAEDLYREVNTSFYLKATIEAAKQKNGKVSLKAMILPKNDEKTGNYFLLSIVNQKEPLKALLEVQWPWFNFESDAECLSSLVNVLERFSPILVIHDETSLALETNMTLH